MYQQQQPQQQQEKNPNAGYLNENRYGLFGKVPVTPELLAEIQRTGFVTVSVGKPEQRGTGNDTWVSAYCAFKPYVPREAAPGGYAQSYSSQPQQPNYNQAPVAPQGNYQQPQNQQPMQGGYDPMADEIPF